LNYISTLFPYEKKRKIHFQSWVVKKKKWVMGIFPKKEIINQNDKELFDRVSG